MGGYLTHLFGAFARILIALTTLILAATITAVVAPEFYVLLLLQSIRDAFIN